MRLIDADELIEWINKQREQVTKKQVAGTDGSIFTREDLVAIQRCTSTFETKIRNVPTAFDTEKVVEQMEEKRNNYQYEMEQCIFKALPYHDILEGKIIGIIDAIDIVKKGGVE